MTKEKTEVKTKRYALDEVIAIAKEAKGYLVTISVRHHDEAGGLEHVTFTHNYLRGDIMSSLDEVAKLLESEVEG